MRQEYKTLAHPEQDLKRQNAPCESGNLPMASIRARALRTRRPRRSSHQAGEPIAAPSNLKLAVPFQMHPGKKVRPKRLRRSARRNDFSLSQVDHQSDAAETPDHDTFNSMNSAGRDV